MWKIYEMENYDSCHYDNVIARLDIFLSVIFPPSRYFSIRSQSLKHAIINTVETADNGPLIRNFGCNGHSFQSQWAGMMENCIACTEIA